MAKKPKKDIAVNPEKKQKKNILAKLEKAIRKLKMFELELKTKEKRLGKELKKLKLDGLKEIKSKKDKKQQKATKSKKKSKEEKNKTGLKKKTSISQPNTAAAGTANAEKSALPAGKKAPKPIKVAVVKRKINTTQTDQLAKKEPSQLSKDFKFSDALIQIRKATSTNELQTFVKGDTRLTIKNAATAKLKSLAKKGK